jgi:hypothetical protein
MLNTIDRALALRTSYREILVARNGHWGTCVYCPRDADGVPHPERCDDYSRSDHHLPASSTHRGEGVATTEDIAAMARVLFERALKPTKTGQPAVDAKAEWDLAWDCVRTAEEKFYPRRG